MAVVGSKTYLNAFTVFVDYTTSQSVATNTSTVKARLGLTVGTYGSISVSQRNCSLTVAGTTKTVTMPAISSNSGSSNTYYSGWAEFPNISHNSDGTKNISLSGSYSVQVTINGTYYSSWSTNSASVTLPKIPRATTITSVSNINSSSTALPLNLSKKLSSYTHYISLKIGSNFIGEWNKTTIANQDGVRNLPLNDIHRDRIKKAMPSSTSATGTVSVTTYSGTTTIGSSSKSLTITINASEKPIISTFTQTASTKFNLSNVTKNILVQNVGNLSFNFGVSAPYGTSLKSTSSTFCGKSSSAVSGSFVASNFGSQSFVSKATDKRGRTNSSTKTYTVLAYSTPELVIKYAGRPRDSNTKKHYAQIEISTKVSSVKPGTTELNKYKVTIQTKETGASSWDTVEEQTYTTAGIAPGLTYTPLQIYDETKSFDVRVLLQDEFRTVTATSKIGTANYLMALGKKGVGFGKLPEGSRVLDVGGDIWDRNGRNLSETVQKLQAMDFKAHRLSVAANEGAMIINKSTLGVDNPMNYVWTVSVEYASGIGTTYSISIQPMTTALNVYLRNPDGTLPSDTSFHVNVLGAKR